MTEEKNGIRVRFAPSPTGYLHVGSARTALFNWFFAKSKNGTFLLRIEDTDRKRSERKYLEEIQGSLKWLGLVWDERPCHQSKRQRLYEKYAKKLLSLDKAYTARGGAIAFRVPKDKIVINDLIHGPIEFDNTLLEDVIIMKSDGTPTYNFACVMDDIDMGITHVIRGDDHISNTPKQMELYRALEYRPPRFAHIPLILGEDRSRLSKRHGATSITEYRKQGYLPEALVNYMALLGWSPGDNREIIPGKEIERIFSLERVGRTSAVFDQNKLNWVNGQYIRNTDTKRLITLIKPYLKKSGFLKKGLKESALKDTVRLFKTRIKTLPDFCGQAEYFFISKLKFNRDAVNKFLRHKELKVIFALLIKDLERLRPFRPHEIEKCCRDLIQRLGIGGGDLIHPVRVAITGRSVSPGLFEVIYLLGKKRTIQRLRSAMKKYCK
jgi:glutamyl-tRNA synthetase